MGIRKDAPRGGIGVYPRTFCKETKGIYWGGSIFTYPKLLPGDISILFYPFFTSGMKPSEFNGKQDKPKGTG